MPITDQELNKNKEGSQQALGRADEAIVKGLTDVAEARRKEIDLTAQSIDKNEQEIKQLKDLTRTDVTYAAQLRMKQQEMMHNLQWIEHLRKEEEEYSKVVDRMGSKLKQAGEGHKSLSDAQKEAASSAKEANASAIASLREMGDTIERTTAKFQEIFAGVKAHVEYKLAVRASADSMSQFGKASDAQVAGLERIRDKLSMTREEWADFTKTLRQGVDMGIDPDKIAAITKNLQRIHGHEVGKQMGAQVLQAEKQAPGVIAAIEKGDHAGLHKATTGIQDFTLRDAATQAMRAGTGEVGGKDAQFSNDMARNTKAIDDMKAAILDWGQKWLGPMAAVSLPAIVVGIGTSVLWLIKIKTAVDSMSGGGSGGLAATATGAAADAASHHTTAAPGAAGAKGGRWRAAAGTGTRIAGTVAATLGADYLMSKGLESTIGEDHAAAMPIRMAGDVAVGYAADKGMTAVGNRIAGTVATQATGQVATTAATQVGTQAATTAATQVGTQAATRAGTSIATTVAAKAAPTIAGRLAGSAAGGPIGLIAGLIGGGVDIAGSHYEDKWRGESKELKGKGDFKGADKLNRSAGMAGGVAAIGNVVAHTATGAGIGAMVGSIVPVIGTGIGAAVGGAIGGVIGLVKEQGRLAEGFKQAFLHKDSAFQKGGPEGTRAKIGLGIGIATAFGPAGLAVAGLGYGVLKVTGTLDQWKRDMESADEITKQWAITQANSVDALVQSIPSVQHFRSAMQAAADASQYGVKQSEGRAAGSIMQNVIAGGGSAADVGALNKKIITGVQEKLSSFDERTATLFKPQKGESWQQAAKRQREEIDKKHALQEKNVEDNLQIFQTEITKQGAMPNKGLERQAKYLWIGKGYSKDWMNAAETGGEAVNRAMAARKQQELGVKGKLTLSENVATYTEKQAALELEISQAASIAQQHARLTTLTENRLAPLRTEAKIQQSLLGIYGSIEGDSKRILASHEKRIALTKEEQIQSAQNLVEIEKAYEEQKAVIDFMRKSGKKDEADRMEERKETEYNVAKAKEKEKGITAFTDRLGSFGDMVQGLATSSKTSQVYRESESRKGQAQAKVEMGTFLGMDPAATKVAFESVAKESRVMADELQGSLAARLASMDKGLEVEIAALGKKATTEEVAALTTRKNQAAIQAQTEALNANRQAFQDSRAVIMAVADAEQRRIGTDRELLEQQKGLAEFVGASYQTQLSIQKDILQLKGQELASVEKQMAAMIQGAQAMEKAGQAGAVEALKASPAFQEIEKKKAQVAADLFKNSIGVQRDFLDKSLGRMFGVTTGSKFQPGAGNQEFMARRIFGEHTIGKGGLRIAGQVSPDEQRKQLQKGALMGLDGRPVGNAQPGKIGTGPMVIPQMADKIQAGGGDKVQAGKNQLAPPGQVVLPGNGPLVPLPIPDGAKDAGPIARIEVTRPIPLPVEVVGMNQGVIQALLGKAPVPGGKDPILPGKSPNLLGSNGAIVGTMMGGVGPQIQSSRREAHPANMLWSAEQENTISAPGDLAAPSSPSVHVDFPEFPRLGEAQGKASSPTAPMAMGREKSASSVTSHPFEKIQAMLRERLATPYKEGLGLESAKGESLESQSQLPVLGLPGPFFGQYHPPAAVVPGMAGDLFGRFAPPPADVPGVAGNLFGKFRPQSAEVPGLAGPLQGRFEHPPIDLLARPGEMRGRFRTQELQVPGVVGQLIGKYRVPPTEVPGLPGSLLGRFNVPPADVAGQAGTLFGKYQPPVMEIPGTVGALRGRFEHDPIDLAARPGALRGGFKAPPVELSGVIGKVLGQFDTPETEVRGVPGDLMGRYTIPPASVPGQAGTLFGKFRSQNLDVAGTAGSLYGRFDHPPLDLDATPGNLLGQFRSLPAQVSGVVGNLLGQFRPPPAQLSALPGDVIGAFAVPPASVPGQAGNLFGQYMSPSLEVRGQAGSLVGQFSHPTLDLKGRLVDVQNVFDQSAVKIPAIPALRTPGEVDLPRLKQVDKAVRDHEQAHWRVAGEHVIGGPHLEGWVQGPDGMQYATAGHVNINMEEAETPEKTVRKMRQIRDAAVAPASLPGIASTLSDADRHVAAEATRIERKALRQLGQPVMTQAQAYMPAIAPTATGPLATSTGSKVMRSSVVTAVSPAMVVQAAPEPLSIASPRQMSPFQPAQPTQPTQPRPATPVQPAAQAPSIVDVSGNISVHVTVAQDGRLEAFVQRVVMRMSAEGAIIRGRRGMPGSGS